MAKQSWKLSELAKNDVVKMYRMNRKLKTIEWKHGITDAAVYHILKARGLSKNRK